LVEAKEAGMSKLTHQEKKQIVRLMEEGWSKSGIATQMGISRVSVYKWLNRYIDEGPQALEIQRSSAPLNPTKKIDRRVRRKILKLAVRQPLRGPKWYSQHLRLSISRTSIHKVLSKAGLGKRQDRLERVLTSENSLFLINSNTVQSRYALSNCFTQKRAFCETPDQDFFYIQRKVPIMGSSRHYTLILIVDRFDFTAQIIIDNRAFWDFHQNRSLMKVLGEQGLPSLTGYKDMARILVWTRLLKEPRTSLPAKVTLPYTNDDLKRYYARFPEQTASLNVNVNLSLRSTICSLPWMNNLLAALKSLVIEPLYTELSEKPRHGEGLRLFTCTESAVKFLKDYHNKPIDFYPFFGASPRIYRNFDKSIHSEKKRVGSVHQLLSLSDKTKPAPIPPTMDEVLNLI
jgi:transposase-like protein